VRKNDDVAKRQDWKRSGHGLYMGGALASRNKPARLAGTIRPGAR
jgi:hypothetical protein